MTTIYVVFIKNSNSNWMADKVFLNPDWAEELKEEWEKVVEDGPWQAIVKEVEVEEPC